MSQENSTNSTPACTSPEARQFDFWLGEWHLTWGEQGRGTNRIEAILDGCVILEQFDGAPSTTFKGMSISTHNSETGLWQQTWVDNQGGYLDFTGTFQDGQMILSRNAILEGRPVKQRMVWHNINPNHLDWSWERSDDGGNTWQTVWQIHYKRKN